MTLKQILIAGLATLTTAYTNIPYKIRPKLKLIAGLTALTIASNISYKMEDYDNGYHIVNIFTGVHSQLHFMRKQNGCADSVIETNLLHLGTSWIYDSGVDGEVNDGLVDRIAGYKDYGRFLIRSKDYDNFKDEFDEADRRLAEIKEMSAEYYPEFPRRCNINSRGY